MLAGASVQVVERRGRVVRGKERREECVAGLLRTLLVGGLDVDVACFVRVQVETLAHAACDATNLELARRTDGSGVVRLLTQ